MSGSTHPYTQPSTTPSSSNFGSFVFPSTYQDGTFPAVGITPSRPTEPFQSTSSTSVTIDITNTCAICLNTMSPGQGQAIFTAECSHAFHFECVGSNVRHGNQMCPVCRTIWKQVPFYRPSPGSPRASPVFPQGSPRHRINPSGWTQDDDGTTGTPEPRFFNDDEPLERQTEVVEKSSSIRNAVDGNRISPIDVTIYPEVQAVPRSDSIENFTVLIHMKAPCSTDDLGRNQLSSQQTSRAPVDLVAVLDVSGSMRGNKLALLKRAMGFVIENLGPSDRLSVISFSTRARRHFPLSRMTDSGRQQALQAVNSLMSEGSTNIAEGLRKGAKVMEDCREKNPVASIILFSDGQDTCGLKSSLNYTPFSVSGGGNSGFQIPIHAFGFGADHDATLMHSISEASRGTFSYIEDDGVIQDAFAQCIGGLLSVMVQGLRVSINCVHPDIRLSSLNAGNYSTSVKDHARSGSIDVGDLYAEEEKNFLVAVNVPVSDLSNEMTLLSVHCVYRDPVSNEALTLEGKEVKIQRPRIVSEDVVSLEVDRQKNRVRASEAIADARIAAEKGDFSGAVFNLEDVRKALAETVSARAGDSLCVSLNAELTEMLARMSSRKTYESSGRAFVLSGMSSHLNQRATTRGHPNAAFGCAYRTRKMRKMLSSSKAYTEMNDSHLPQPPVDPPHSGPPEPQ